MEAINVRFGETFNMAISTDDVTATDAALLIGNVGEPTLLTITASLTNGVGQFSATDEQMSTLPVGTYSYQISVVHSDGKLEKYPAPDDCESGKLPTFKVHESIQDQQGLY